MNFEIIHLKRVDSTNKYALSFVETSPKKNGLVIWADEQTEGRGHGDNSWESEAGKNLTFTLVIKPLYIPPASQFLITQMVSVALQKTIENITAKNDILLKWPNDMYAGNKKLAGMLIQNVIKGDKIDVSAIGIGLNVNQENFNPGLPNPISILQLTKKVFDREKLLNEFLLAFQNEYEKSGSPLFQEIISKNYFEKMYLFNKWATYQLGNEVFKGKILGVGPFGHLLLKLENGEERQFGFKEVELIQDKR